MKCTRCGWSTSIGQRDILNGLCAECRKIAADAPDFDPEDAKQLALTAHAGTALARGQSPDRVLEQLLSAGCEKDVATRVMTEASARQAAFVLAAEMLDKGAGVLQVRNKLIEMGQPLVTAGEIVERIQQQRSGVDAEGTPVRSSPGATALVVVAATIFSLLSLFGLMGSFAIGGIMPLGYLIAQTGQIWLLILIIRECRADAIAYAFLIPFFTWYFAVKRPDIATLPLFLNLIGIVLLVVRLFT
jgi:hypothetical protein